MKNKTNYQKVREFQEAMGQPLDRPWEVDAESRRLDNLRVQLLKEEFEEILKAPTNDNLLKELCDLLYVTYGYAATFGWDIDTAFNRVHQSNMSKLDENGKPIYRGDGKVMKGPNYSPPDLEDLV